MSKSTLESQIISFLRFPLCIGVILIHSDFSHTIIQGVKCINEVNFPIYTNISYLISEILARTAVPLFFFISGFLFFYKQETLNFNTYTHKLKKRFHSILIPYIFWNLLIIIFYYIIQSITPELLSGTKKLICNYNLTDWLWTFWDTTQITPSEESGMPIDFPLWFIRDLIIVFIFSPLIYFLIKRTNKIVILILCILWITNCWFNISGFSIDAFFFFSFGAYFSLNQKGFVDIMKPYCILSVILYLILISIELYYRNNIELKSYVEYLHKINILIGVIMIITTSAYFISKGEWTINPFYEKSTFFIYAYHGLPLTFVSKILLKTIKPYTELSLLTI